MNIIEKIKNFITGDDGIGDPPYDYDFLLNLDESEYEKYLRKIYKVRMGHSLNLKNPKTFSEKVQFLKLYDTTPLKRQLTDKIAVRDYIKDKIGEEYLKPLIQVCNDFDEIDFEKLPEAFVMKCSHGRGWHQIIKNKEKYLEAKPLIDITRRKITEWLDQEFWTWNGFELQYKGINPKIMLEPLFRENINLPGREIQVYCFSGEPEIIINAAFNGEPEFCFYDKNFEYTDLILHPDGLRFIRQAPANDLIKQAAELSRKLSGDFKLVMIDWIEYQGKLYFGEFEFTPYSGLINLNPKLDEKLGSLIKLK